MGGLEQSEPLKSVRAIEPLKSVRNLVKLMFSVYLHLVYWTSDSVYLKHTGVLKFGKVDLK